MDLTAHKDMTAESSLRFAHDRDLRRYDAIVVILGVNDALKYTAPALWREQLLALLTALLESSSMDTKVVFVGIQPIRSIAPFDNWLGALSDHHAGLLNRETEKICARHDRATFAPLPAPTDLATKERHRTQRQYEGWGRVLAETIVPLIRENHALDGDRRRHYYTLPSHDAEIDRQAAVDNMPALEAETEDRLNRVMALAQRAFKVQTAMITILDHDRQRQLVGTSGSTMEIRRADSFCEFAVHGNEAMIVRDALQDERFQNNPLVLGEPHIRFYAGFPIESPTGHRVGALCVVDSQPRRRNDDIDVDFLRELAHIAQHELWKDIPPTKSER